MSVIVVFLLLIPGLFIRHFKSLKVLYFISFIIQLIAFLIFFANLALLTMLAVQWFNFGSNSAHINCDVEVNDQVVDFKFLTSRSPWNHFHIYGVFFQFQTYQLIIYSYVGQKKKSYNGRLVSITTIALVVFFTASLSLLFT